MRTQILVSNIHSTHHTKTFGKQDFSKHFDLSNHISQEVQILCVHWNCVIKSWFPLIECSNSNLQSGSKNLFVQQFFVAGTGTTYNY